MSRPRRPFGNDHPGRLPATMIKVLAAEASDAGRLSRGKRLWADEAVIDLVVGHGVVTAEVQGSHPAPYVVTIETKAGHQVPARAQLTIRCTCPDDDGVGRSACKHAVATLFALADEVLIEPDLVARWRRSDTVPEHPADEHDPATSDASGPSASTPVHSPDRGVARTRERPAERDPLAEFLDWPVGAMLPALPELPEPVDARLADPLAARVLDDALAVLHVPWD